MISKRFRLSARDINYILRKGQKIHTHRFSIFVIPQYSSNHYHQISPQISSKIHKRATVRNAIRRAIIDGFYNALTPIQLPYGKFLIMPNKQQEVKRVASLASLEKKNIYTTILQRIQQELFSISQQRGIKA